MLPIKAGCTALIINWPPNSGEVKVIGKCTDVPHGVVSTTTLWNIDRPCEWPIFHSFAGVEYKSLLPNKLYKLAPESKLMRLDGIQFESDDIQAYHDEPVFEIID